jgi:hypothetical protein
LKKSFLWLHPTCDYDVSFFDVHMLETIIKSSVFKALSGFLFKALILKARNKNKNLLDIYFNFFFFIFNVKQILFPGL